MVSSYQNIYLKLFTSHLEACMSKLRRWLCKSVKCEKFTTKVFHTARHSPFIYTFIWNQKLGQSLNEVLIKHQWLSSKTVNAQRGWCDILVSVTAQGPTVEEMETWDILHLFVSATVVNTAVLLTGLSWLLVLQHLYVIQVCSFMMNVCKCSLIS